LKIRLSADESDRLARRAADARRSVADFARLVLLDELPEAEASASSSTRRVAA
jgi:hypothetical protein